MLRLASQAIGRHSEKVTKLHEVAGTGKHETFTRIAEEARITFREAKSAWDAYKGHVEQHGC